MPHPHKTPSTFRIYILFPLVTGIIGAVASGVTVEYLKLRLLTSASSDTSQLIDLNKQALGIVDRMVQHRADQDVTADASRLQAIVNTMQSTTMSLQRSISQAKSFLPPRIDPPAPSKLAGMGPIEHETNRRGSDIGGFTLNIAAPEECRSICGAVKDCVAWTYVRPNTIQGPLPRCWIKGSLPNPSQDSCCESGVKFAKSQ